MRPAFLALAAALLSGLAAGPTVGPARAAADPALPAAPRMQFTPPDPGSYALQRIQPAADGELLDAASRPLRLSELTRGRLTLLTFFYTQCDDPLGCPFALGLLNALRARILADRELDGAVRFVSISFDPGRDSPQQLRRYARRLLDDPRFEWRFLTARSPAQLQPVLDGFGQDVRVSAGAGGRPRQAIDHLLKLFLIDAQGVVREIYTLDYLQQDEMLNDLRTLRREAAAGGPRGRPSQPPPSSQGSSASGRSMTASAPQLARSVSPAR